jgi:delta 1-pyrroline-5-carboxylate dehydrogenase
MNERDQRRVIGVVVGVTPHPGDGSAVTGQRVTGNFVQSLVSIEVLDLMKDPLRELEHLSKLASADPTKRLSDLYRLVGHGKLLALAAERVRQNTGGRTAGIDGQTRKAIDVSRLSQLAEELASHHYQPQAVRRGYIPKGKSGRRALGIP